MKFINLRSLFLFFITLTGVFLFSCAFNKTLAVFDLGNNRVAKIVTGNEMDPSLPFYCELFIDGKSVGSFVVEFEETGKYSVVNKYRYELVTDKSKKLFVIIQTAPESSRNPIAVFDFNEDFGYPVCPIQKCLDCHGGYCAGNSEMCIKKSNEVVRQVEADNPNIKLKPYEWNAPKSCGNNEQAALLENL